MAGALRHRSGGILSLLTLLDEHQEAVEYDLISLGLRLRDLGDTFTWHDLKIVVGGLPQDSAVSRSILGPDYIWDNLSQLLATAVDELRVANWMQTEDATKKFPANRPEPIPRPGLKKAKPRKREAVSIEEMAARLRDRKLTVVQNPE